jgi:hypothetical protein
MVCTAFPNMLLKPIWWHEQVVVTKKHEKKKHREKERKKERNQGSLMEEWRQGESAKFVLKLGKNDT